MVKLHQCFLLVAIGLATAASAAAIAKGNEQSVNIERRSVDTRHAQEIARRAIDGDGQRWMEPGSTGQESGSPRRRTTDSDNDSRYNSGDGTSPPPSRQSEQDGSGNGRSGRPLTNVDDTEEVDPSQAKQQLEAIINADAEQQMAEFFAQYGHCKGPESKTCQHHSCLLTSSDCSPFTPKEKQELSDQTKQILFALATTGKCTPSRDAAEWCSKTGYCDYFDLLGATDDAGNPACDRLSKEEYTDLVSRIRPQPDGSIDVADDDDDKQDGVRSDMSVKRGSSPYETQHKMVKRFFGKRSDDTAANTDDNSAHGADNTVDFMGVKMTQKQVKQRAIRDAKETMDVLYTHGICEEGSTTCDSNPCHPSTPGCFHLTDEQKAETLKLMTRVVTEVYTSGKCDRPNTGNCDAERHCQLWLSNGERDHNCEPLTVDELNSKLNAEAKKLPTSSDTQADAPEGYGDAESESSLHKRALLKAKRDADDDKITFFGGVRVDQMGLAQHVLEYAQNALNSVADLYGHRNVCEGAKSDPKQPKGGKPAACHVETCSVSKDQGCEPPSQADLAALKTKLRIAYTRLFYSGSCDAAVSQKDGNCDASGWCQLWLSDNKRDHSCKELTSEQSQERLRAILGKLTDADDAEPSTADDTISFDGAQLTQMQLAQQVVNWAVRAMSQETRARVRGLGRCDEASATCVGPKCVLGTDGCRPFTEEEAAALEAKYEIIFTRVMFSGACEPKVSQKDGNCDRFGRCQLWLSNGKHDQHCNVYDHLQFNKTLDSVAGQLDGWGTLLPPLPRPGQDGDSGYGNVKREVHLDVRALFDDEFDSINAKVKRDVPSLSSSGYTVHAAEIQTLTRDQIREVADEFASRIMDEPEIKPSCPQYRSTCLEAKQEISKEMFSVLVSGSCDASAGGSSHCDKQGQCNLFLKDGTRNKYCRILTDDEMEARLHVMAGDLEKWAKGHAPVADDKADNRKQKRDAALLKWDMFNGQADSVSQMIKRAFASSADDDNTANYSGQHLTEKDVRHLADEAAASAITHAEGTDFDKAQAQKDLSEAMFNVFSSGKCDATGTDLAECDKTGRCKLWVEHKRDYGCHTLTKKEMGARFDADMARWYGSDSAEASTPGTAGQGTSSDETAGKLGKRNVHLLKRVLSDGGAESIYAKIKREVDANSANYPDGPLTEKQAIQRINGAVEGVFAAGYEVPGYSKEQLRRAIRKTLVSIYTSGKCDVSTGGNNCDATGRCKLWVNHKRDHGCSALTSEEIEERLVADWNKVFMSYAAEDTTTGAKNDELQRPAKRHLIKRVVSQEPVRQELLKRVELLHGDERDSRHSGQVTSDYLTVPASSLNSESDLYQPDPQEVWRAQNTFREISKNPAALREIANAMGLYKDEDIEALAEFYALLADNPSETIKLIQRAKLTEELTDSKSLVGSGSEHGGKRATEAMEEGVEKLSQ